MGPEDPRWIEVWSALPGERGRTLIATLEQRHDLGPGVIGDLRERFPKPLVTAAVELVLARRRARGRIANAQALWFDREAVEQATSTAVATHKAKRFAALDPVPARIFDLCCGAGGDALALRDVCPLVLVDRSPLRAWMARQNAGAPAIAQDVLRLRLRDAVFHLDPARRAGGRRIRRFEDYRPGPAYLTRLLEHNPCGAVKLGPGVALDELPSIGGTTEIELISDRGALVQTVLWTGRLAHHPGRRTATLLPQGCSLTGSPGEPHGAPLGQYLYEADPAVERARLLGHLAEAVGAGALHPSQRLLTSDDRLHSPWLAPFEVLDSMPWRERKVRAWLRAHRAGQVEVKTRGGFVDPNALQKKLSTSEGLPVTLFVLRLDKNRIAILTRRLPKTDLGPTTSGEPAPPTG